MKPLKNIRLSVTEYIQYEIDMNRKYEFHNGEIYALAGGTIEHALLVGNIYAELRNGLKTKQPSCKPITSEAKLHIDKDNKYLYPDTMVICGDILRSEETNDAITNPTLIVEVLSKSTVEYDKGDKFYFYRQIPSLKEYVLIEQERYVVEVYYKKDDNDLWQISRYEGYDEIITLQSLDLKIKMSELYFDIPIDENHQNL